MKKSILALAMLLLTSSAFGLTPYHEEYSPETVFNWEEKEGPVRAPANMAETKGYWEETSPRTVMHWEWNDRMPSSTTDKKVNYREIEEFSPENVFKY